jgi:thiamine pyrophosphate-dependent acetolactate synthase large subunit-like protein
VTSGPADARPIHDGPVNEGSIHGGPASGGEGSVAGAVLRMLRSAGAEVVFGLPGVHNLSFWQDAGEGAARIVGVRHEQTCVYAADGWARSTGRLGAGLVTTGPGAANAVGAFGEAAASGSPVVLVASDVSTVLSEPGVVKGLLHESRDQAAIYEPLAKAVFRPTTPAGAVADVAEAILTALTGPRGPVFVSIPTDVLQSACEPVTVGSLPRLAPDPSQLDAAAALVRAAGSVAIWVGGGAVQSGAETALLQLAERLGAPVFTTFAARGLVPSGHPAYTGVPVHEPESEALLAGSDLLLAVGTDFDGMDTKNWSIRLPPRLVSVNCDVTDMTKNYMPDLAVHADARLAVEGLLDRLDTAARRPPAGTDKAFTAPGMLRPTVWKRLTSDPRTAAASRLVDAVDRAAEAVQAVVVADMCIPGYWVGGYSALAGARRVQYPVGWGTLGYALPASIGAALGSGRPALVVSGDGGFMFGLGELAVIAQEQLPITVLLVDDCGYGMLRFDQVRAGVPEAGVDLFGPDFLKLADSFGIEGVLFDGFDDQVESSLKASLSDGRPRLVVLRESLLPPRTTSPRWRD